MSARLISVLSMVLLIGGTTAEAARPGRSGPSRQAVSSDGLREIVTDDYTVRTDLPDEDLPMLMQRLGAMVREYRDRTADLSDRSDDRRLPFNLYSDLGAYTAAGGTPGSAGIFDGERLLAYVGRRPDARAWNTIQHEAFHQYLSAKLGYEVPIWLNEGLAEYFGESLYTGDRFVSGIVPPWRLRRVRATFSERGFLPLRELLSMSHEQWNTALSQANYDQAWSLVHFLAHADGGAHQGQLTQYIRESGRGTDPVRAFTGSFGNLGAMEDAWATYWRDLSDDDINRTYGEVAVRTVCSFLGRAYPRSRPGTVDELVTLARAGELPQGQGQELPPDLLTGCMDWGRKLGEWQLDLAPRSKAKVKLKLRDGTLIQGDYTIRGGKFHSTETWTTMPSDAPASRAAEGAVRRSPGR